MDRGAWWATAHGVPKSQTHLGPTTAKHLKKKKKMLVNTIREFQNAEKKEKETGNKMNRLEQRKQRRGNDQREDVEKSPDINNCHEYSE